MSFTDDYGHQHFAPTIIAAPAGAFTALTWHRLDDLAGHSVELPVIAFDCSDTAFPRPIAILSMGQVQAIRYADGRVLDLPDGCEFADRGAWHQHAKTRANEWAVEASR